MIDIDASVALAALFDERQKPPLEFWKSAIYSSQLLEYEMIVGLNAVGAPSMAFELAQELLSRAILIDLDRPTRARSNRFPWPCARSMPCTSPRSHI